MPEQPSPVKPEGTPFPEGPTSKEQVIQAFNDASLRWQAKIHKLREDINPNLEIDNLVGTDPHTPGQKRPLTEADRVKFAEYRTFVKGVKGLTRNDYPAIYDPQTTDELTVSFRNSQTGEVIHRQENLDISGLIESASEDVELARQQLASAQSLTGFRSLFEKKVHDYERDLKILKDNSTLYTEMFPDALNEANPVEKGRIREEARRIWDHPLTRKPTMQEDWETAKDRLKNARLLKIPPKEESQPPSREEPLVAITSTSSVQPHRPDTYPEPTTFPLAYPLLPTSPYSPASSPLRGMEASLPFPPKAYRTPPPFPAETPKPKIHKEYDDNNLGDIYRKVVSDLKNFINKKAAENDEFTVEDIEYRIRNWSGILGKETRKYDPVISKKVEKLKEIKIPDRHRFGLGVLLLPVAVVLLALCNPADTKGVPKPSEPPTGGAPSAPAPEFKPPLPTTNLPQTPEFPPTIQPPEVPPTSERPLPKNLEEFKQGVGLQQIGFADYTQGTDYQQKLDEDNPDREIDKLEGYSVKGLTEAEIGYLMNPDLYERADKLGGIPVDDPQLHKTLALLKERLDAYYGQGTFESLVNDYTERMKAVINRHSADHIPVLQPSFNEKIINGKFISWLPTLEETDAWFKFKTANSQLNPVHWRQVREEITQQVREEMKNQ